MKKLESNDELVIPDKSQFNKDAEDIKLKYIAFVEQYKHKFNNKFNERKLKTKPKSYTYTKNKLERMLRVERLFYISKHYAKKLTKKEMHKLANLKKFN